MAGPIESAQVRRFGCSVLSVLFRTPVLVLDTTVRRSGATRSTTPAYHRLDDGSLLIAGGAGGQSRVADWVLNLRANPKATVTVDRMRTPVCAFELEGRDRELGWRALRQVWPRIDGYQRRAGRTIPVFRLNPPGCLAPGDWDGG